MLVSAERERERVLEQGKGQRERENLKPTPRQVGSPMWGSIP